jgi:hypothetical protein
MENSMEAPQKTKIELPYGPATTFLGIYSKEYEAGYNKDIFTPIFIAALFIITNL